MTAIISHTAPKEAEETLRRLGYDVLRIPPHPALPSPVASHPDMLLFFASDAIFCTQSYAKLAQAELSLICERTRRPLCTVNGELGATYPHDVLFNAARVGKKLFCLPHATAQEISASPDVTVIPVRQGYAKCSVIPVGDNALICADPSIAKAALKEGLEVLRVHADGIRLEGYDCGFPGGCTSSAPYIDTTTILFCGAVSLHPDAAAMQDFCARHKHHLISLGDFPPTDVGTIFLI
ncbi:MAG: hypothetical protein E7643_07630 [Ruminococcaceae bacterium]|nr:hypothetical protein [Oscillospiraceae bacterium]